MGINPKQGHISLREHHCLLRSLLLLGKSFLLGGAIIYRLAREEIKLERWLSLYGHTSSYHTAPLPYPTLVLAQKKPGPVSTLALLLFCVAFLSVMLSQFL